MSTLIDIVIPRHAVDIEPDLYASIFETDEAHLLQSKVAQAHQLIDAALKGTDIEIVSDAFWEPVPGALAVPFQTRLPEDIYKAFDADYRTGATHNGLVTGRLRLPRNTSKDFYVEYYGKRTTGSLGWFRQHIPSSTETNLTPKIRMNAQRARLGLLGVAAASVFAEQWDIADTRTVGPRNY